MTEETTSAPVSALELSPTPKKSFWAKAGSITKTVWEVPAVKSVALTWIIRIGAPPAIAGIVIAVADAFAVNL